MSDSKSVIWVHGDALSPRHPVFLQASGAPALFVWDDALLQEWRISLKRVLFMYECLLEIPVTIRRGDVAMEVLRFAQEHSAARILTPSSPSPRHRWWCQRIAALMPDTTSLQLVPDEPFVPDDYPYDLKRFSRYWQAARNHVLDPRR